MKILYLSSLCSITEYERLFERYGTTSSHASQKFHRLLTRGLIENGVQIETVTHRSLQKVSSDALKEASEQVDGITYNYLPQTKHKKFNRLYIIIKAYQKLKRLKKGYKDMLICVDILRGELSIAANLFRCFHKCKTIGILTDVPVFRAFEARTGLKALPVKMKNFLISRYDCYVFLTEQMNEDFNPKNKPYVIIEGIADDKALESPNELSTKYPEKVVMMAGLLEKEFGVDDLLEAFHNIELPNISLHLYGKGKSVELIEEYVKKDKRIHFFGEALNKVIVEKERKATLLVNPRKATGEWVKYSFPSKNMEYIASGTPLLAYDLPCIPPDYKNKYFEVENDDLRAALEKCLLMENEELHRFGKIAQNWISENKNPKKQTKKIVNMLSIN